MHKILIVEDEIAISQVLKAYLKKAGYETKQVYTGEEAIDEFREYKPDLVLLDVMLPGKSGWDILKEIRIESTCPVIMLTALGDVNYRLSGLNDGADDYITKPFVGDEVVARIQAVLRRSVQVIDDKERKQYGSLSINMKAHSVTLHGIELDLTPRDLALLIFLSQHPNQLFTRDQLIDHVWGIDYDGSDRAVDLSIKRLRKALNNWPSTEGEIKTSRGLGYQLSVYDKK